MTSQETPATDSRSQVISVIVPVYNVEKYLRQCLDSIINQTYPHLEIILVNDGSTDSSGDICDEYAALDPRVKVFHKPNGGLSSARNYGLQYVTGDYIAYVDSDDWIDLDLYKRCIDKFKSDTRIDAVFYDVNEVFLDKEVYSLIGDVKEFAYSDVTPNRYILELYSFGKSFSPAVWNKVYKADIIKDLRFVDGKNYEDVSYTFLAISRIKGYSLLSPGETYTGYNYRKTNKDSITYSIKGNVAHLYEQITNLYASLEKEQPELLPYLGTLGANRIDWLLSEPNLSEEVLKVAAKYLKPMYSLKHLKAWPSNRIKRLLIYLTPRLLVLLYYKKWLPRLEK